MYVFLKYKFKIIKVQRKQKKSHTKCNVMHPVGRNDMCCFIVRKRKSENLQNGDR